MVFPTSDVVFGVLGKGCRYLFFGNYMNDVCCLLIAHGIYVGAYAIRPVHHRVNRIGKHRQNIASRRISWRMQYTPTAAQFLG